ncbi:hypothetical protein MMC29_007598 [Sticta canariensis]|nr:hypothetical protein [Sticta canariensis]
MEAPRPARTSFPWETTPGVWIDDPYAAKSKEPGLLMGSKAPSEYTGSTQKTINQVISFGDHLHGTPPGEVEFLGIRSKVNGHEQKPIRKVVFRDTGDTGEKMDEWILRVLTSELDTLRSFPVPIKLMDMDGEFVRYEVTKVKGDARGGSSKMTLDWLIYEFEGPQGELTIEYGYNNAEKDFETEGMEVDSHELPYRMNEVESHKPCYRVRSLLRARYRDQVRVHKRTYCYRRLVSVFAWRGKRMFVDLWGV